MSMLEDIANFNNLLLAHNMETSNFDMDYTNQADISTDDNGYFCSFVPLVKVSSAPYTDTNVFLLSNNHKLCDGNEYILNLSLVNDLLSYMVLNNLFLTYELAEMSLDDTKVLKGECDVVRRQLDHAATITYDGKIRCKEFSVDNVRFNAVIGSSNNELHKELEVFMSNLINYFCYNPIESKTDREIVEVISQLLSCIFPIALNESYDFTGYVEHKDEFEIDENSVIGDLLADSNSSYDPVDAINESMMLFYTEEKMETCRILIQGIVEELKAISPTPYVKDMSIFYKYFDLDSRNIMFDSQLTLAPLSIKKINIPVFTDDISYVNFNGDMIKMISDHNLKHHLGINSSFPLVGEFIYSFIVEYDIGQIVAFNVVDSDNSLVRRGEKRRSEIVLYYI